MNPFYLGEPIMSIFKNMFSSVEKFTTSVLAGLASFYAPVYVPITAIAVLMIVDAIYGYKVSKKYGQTKVESHKAWKTIYKIRDAVIAICGAFTIDQLIITSIDLHAIEFIAGAIALVEFWSLLESLCELHPKWKVWSVLKERNTQMSNLMKNYQMITVLLKVVNWFAKYYKIVAVGLVSLLIATIFIQNHKLQKLNKEIDRVTNNLRSYEESTSDLTKRNRVLQLTIDELNTSQDSLIQQVNETKKKLKIKDKNLTNVSVINTEIKDSVKTVIKHKLVDFKEELKLNELTTIIVSRKDSILKAKLDITNQQIIFVENKREYRRKYKSWLSRFLRFDFKKITTRQYHIENSNPLIKVTDTRVIEVSK